MNVTAATAGSSTHTSAADGRAKARANSRWPLVAMVGLVLLATGLRLFRLDTVSVRGDEAFTIFFSVMPLSEIFAVLRSGEPHPPGFFLTFRYWELVTGPSPFAARYFSALASIAVVPLAYQLARRVAVERPQVTGVAAALLVALSPDLLWHAQDARMYSLMAALMLVIFIATLEYVRTRQRRWLVAYSAVALYGVLVHYYLSVGLVAVNLAFVVGLVLDRHRRSVAELRRTILEWATAQAVVLLVLAPWFYFARNLLGGFEPGWTEPTPIPEMLLRTVQVAVLGTSVDAELAGRVVWLLLALTAAGIILMLLRSASTGAYMATLLVGPILVVAALSVRTPIYLERYLVYLTPLVLVIIATAIVAVARHQRLLSGALAIAVLLPMGLAMHSYYFDVRFAKAPEWREAALTLLHQGQPGDVMIENFPDPAFGVHYRGAGGNLPFELVPPSGDFDPVEMRATVQRLLREHPRAWFLPIQADNWDKDGLVEQYLRAFAVLEADHQFRDVRLLRFRSATASTQGGTVPFESGLRLQPPVVELGTSGDPVRVLLVLETGERLPFRAKAFIHLIGPDGAMRAQQDVELGSGVYPSDAWTAGDTLVERFVLDPGGDLPAGSRLRIGFYDPVTGKRLALADREGDYLEVPLEAAR